MRLILVFIFISSFQINAGDISLVCEDIEGNKIYTDNVMDRPATVEFKDEDIYGTKYIYKITSRMGEVNTYIIVKTLFRGESDSEPTVYTVLTNKLTDEIRVSQNIICALRD